MPEPILPNVTFRRSELNDIIALRYDVLCAGRPREEAQFEGDDLEDTHHFAAFLKNGEGDRNIGCVSYMLNEWDGVPAWQLRGMAIAPDLAKQGIGTRLIRFAEQVLRDASSTRQQWCNARVPAIRFYERLGWAVASEIFEVPNYGPHQKMVATL